MGHIQRNECAWRFIGIQSMDDILPKIRAVGRTGYIDFPMNLRWYLNVKNTKKHALWCILARIKPAKSFVSLTSSDMQHFNNKNRTSRNCGNWLQIKNIAKLEKLNKLSKHAFEQEEAELERRIRLSFLYQNTNPKTKILSQKRDL